MPVADLMASLILSAFLCPDHRREWKFAGPGIASALFLSWGGFRFVRMPTTTTKKKRGANLSHPW